MNTRYFWAASPEKQITIRASTLNCDDLEVYNSSVLYVIGGNVNVAEKIDVNIGYIQLQSTNVSANKIWIRKTKTGANPCNFNVSDISCNEFVIDADGTVAAYSASLRLAILTVEGSFVSGESTFVVSTITVNNTGTIEIQYCVGTILRVNGTAPKGAAQIGTEMKVVTNSLK